MDRLFGLSRLSWWDEQAYLGWQHPLPAWAWALILMGAMSFAGWSYHRLMGGRLSRAGLALVRGLVIVLVAVLLAGPTLVRPDEQVEQDWLLVLVDRSASMQVADTVDPATAEPMSRDAALRRALREQAAVFGPEGLAHERQVAWFGFGRHAYVIESPGDDPPWDEPLAGGTALRTAIEQALESAAGRPISGIVLMTDGRSPETTGAALVRRLQQQAVSVFAVPLGVSPLPLDLGIAQLDAPEQAFARDVVPVSVTVDRFGGAGEVDPARVRVRLVDDATGQVLDERTLEEAGLGEPVKLSARAEQAGQVRWRVELMHEPAAGDAAGDLIERNNARLVTIEMVDRPMHVLYIEGYPRWEYRYLKNLLLREAPIASSMYLLSADRGFAQEGDEPITRLPQTAEEMARYDVVILGDVSPQQLLPEQLVLLRDHVAATGAGLLWIGGPWHTPQAYEGTPLADLLPMRRPGSVSALGSGAVEVVPAPLARALSVLDLRGPSGEVLGDGSGGAGAAVSWPEELLPLQWVQDVGPLKPTAEPIAEGQRVESPDARPLPLIVRLRYGAGQSLYVATDDTWRWRYGRGELYFEQFWIQLVRMLGRQRVQQDADRAQLRVSHRQVEVDEAVVVELELNDPALLERQLPHVAVTVTAGDEPGAPAEDRLELRPAEAGLEGGAPGADRGRRVYRATWRPATSGTLELRVTEPALDPLNIRQVLEVVAPDDELLQPQPDHDRLARLARQTGGAVVPVDELDRLRELVPNRDRRTPNDLREPLWNSHLALGVFLMLITVEWIGRKLVRLV